MTLTTEQAIAKVRNDHRLGLTIPVGTCLMQVHNAFGVPSDGTPNAAAHWERAKYKHPTRNIEDVPRGGLPHWTGGSHGYGHIAIGTGHGSGWSTDLPLSGHWGLIDLDLVRSKWGLEFVGWTEDVDGVRVYTPPTHHHPLIVRAVKAKAGRSRIVAMHELATHPKAPKRAREAASAFLTGHRAQVKAMDTLSQIVAPK